MERFKQPIEYRKYRDEKTGQIHEVPVILHNKRNSNFEMIFYGHLLEILNDHGNATIKICSYILKNKEKSNNVFLGTQKSIAEDLKLNKMTVNKTIKILVEKGVIKKGIGHFLINPDILCDGRFKGKIMHEYQRTSIQKNALGEPYELNHETGEMTLIKDTNE